MKIPARFALLFLVATLSAHAQKVSPADLTAAATGSITRAMDASVVAWNKADIRSFMDCYDNSPETTFVGKTVTHGWQQVLDHYLKVYDTPDKMGRLEFSDLQVRVLEEQIAVVTGRFKLTRSAAAGGDASGIFSLVWKKTAQGWKIVLDHSASD